MSPSHAPFVVFLICLLCAAPVIAQECGPNEVTPWWPRFNATAGAERLSASDRRTIETRLTAVEALMRATTWAKPRGFAVQPWFSYHEITDPTQLYSYEFVLGAMHKCSKYSEGGAQLLLTFNPDPMGWSESDRPLRDEKGDGLYMERVRTPTLFGATATFGRFQEVNGEGLYILFTRGGTSPMLPVTREEYLRAMIFTLEGTNQEKVKAAAAIVSKTPYERWMEEAPQRKKNNEELWAIVASSNPAQAAKMRADMEKAEQAETEKLKNADAYERAQLGKNVAGLTVLGDKYRAQIAQMTPQERASAAFLVGDDLVPAGTANAHAITRKNPAFFRAGASPLEPRAILVHLPNGYEEYWPQQKQAYEQLDWAAIKNMVN